MDLTIEQALLQAVEAHKSGRLQDAERLYRAILQIEPQHPDANHNLGLLAVGASKPSEALPYLKTALRVRPNQRQFWLSHIYALIESGLLSDAQVCLSDGKRLGLSGDAVIQLEQKLEVKTRNQLVVAEQSEAPVDPQKSRKQKITHHKGKHKKQRLQIQEPSQHEINTLLAEFNKGNLSVAKQLASDIIKQFPDHPFGWKAIGAIAYKAGKYQEAFELIRQAICLAPSDVEAYCNLGAALKNLGRLAEAEASYRTAIRLKPDFAEAHSNLSIALKALERLVEAEASCREAIRLKPDYAEAHSNLGAVLMDFGRLAEAEASYREAICLKPDYTEAHSNLGTALKDLGRLAEAEVSYREAIRLKSDYAEAHSNLGAVLMDLGRLAEAEASYRDAIRLKPDFAEAHSNLSVALKAIGRLVEAEASCREAIRLKPDYAEAHSNLGAVLMDLGRLVEAEASYRDAIRLKPDYAKAHSNLGAALRDLGRLAEADVCYREAICLKPDYAEAHCNLGAVLRDLGRMAEAEASFQEAICIDPAYTFALDGLGRLKMDVGSFEQAEAIFLEAPEINPEAPTVWAQLASLRKMTSADSPWLARARELLGNASNTPHIRYQLLYAMGKFCDDTKAYDEAFGYYQEANETKKRIYPRYDAHKRSALSYQIIRANPYEVVNKNRAGSLDSERPLLIVGMPRSGTSLVEQILASHPRTHGAGELRYWSDLATAFPQIFLSGEHAAAELFAIGSDYLNLLKKLNGTAWRVVDKMPGNFAYLGLFHAAFPNARILHMQRNPIDTCLSIYFQDFNSSHAYACDLHDLAHFYREYHNMMAHWREVLPASVLLDVPYERVVEDQEGWSRKIIEFIGLEWSDACLEFHKTERRVGTASNWQARQPIYKTSKERWRNYEKHLVPLLPLLELYDPVKDNE